MITLTLAEVAEIVGGQLNGDPHIRVDSVEFDSRKVTPHTLFVALRGARVDGHDFATSVDGPVLAARPVDAPSVVVPHIDNPQSNADAYAHDPSGDNASVLEALSKLARYNIDHADVTVIGVTGSAGKTSTKDLIASVVQRLGSTVAPPGSFNNELGHPYTALRCDKTTDYLVAELSARGLGHVAHLAQIAPPTIGVVLNVGTAHLGEFGSREVIAQAKGELVAALPSTGVAVLNADDRLVTNMPTSAKVVRFSTTMKADYYATDIQLGELSQASFVLHTPHGQAPVNLQVFGEHQVANALAAAAVGVECGLSVADVAQALSEHTAASAHRMDVQRCGDVVIIDDAYNANPDSMRAGVSALIDATSKKTWAVLGQMNELGEDADAEHRKLGEYLAERGVDTLVAVGTSAQVEALASSAREHGVHTLVASDVQQAVDLVQAELAPGDAVLVKASYSDSLWRVAEGLMQLRRSE